MECLLENPLNFLFSNNKATLNIFDCLKLNGSLRLGNTSWWTKKKMLSSKDTEARKDCV